MVRRSTWLPARPAGHRRRLADQRRHEPARTGHRPGRSAVALGAASVALVAVVAGHAFGAPSGTSAAAELSPTATTTADPAAPKVATGVAAAALRTGVSSTLPSGLRAVSRSLIRPVLPGCSGVVTDYTYPNGQVPAKELCALTFAPGHHLRADAAVALARLNIAYRARFGHDMKLTDSYRTVAAGEPGRAQARPGCRARHQRARHGARRGLRRRRTELRLGGVPLDAPDAPAFGWDNPAWAIPPSSREEPWHWEYVVGDPRLLRRIVSGSC